MPLHFSIRPLRISLLNNNFFLSRSVLILAQFIWKVSSNNHSHLFKNAIRYLQRIGQRASEAARAVVHTIYKIILIVYLCLQLSSDGNQTTSTLSITLSRVDAGRYLSCRAYNHAVQSEVLEDGWRLDIQCKCCSTYVYSNASTQRGHTTQKSN